MKIGIGGKPLDIKNYDEVDFLPRDTGFQVTLKREEKKTEKLSDYKRSHVTNIYFDHSGAEVARTMWDSGWVAVGVDMSLLPSGWKNTEF